MIARKKPRREADMIGTITAEEAEHIANHRFRMRVGDLLVIKRGRRKTRLKIVAISTPRKRRRKST